MGRESALTIRRSERTDVSYLGVLSIRESDSPQVSVLQALGTGDGWLPVDIIDMSPQGLGAISEIFIPRRTAVNVRLFNTADVSEPFCELSAIVQRVIMTDRRPAYLLGIVFHEPDAETLAKINFLTAAFTS